MLATAYSWVVKKTGNWEKIKHGLIQTEAELRRREARVQQAIENGLRSFLFICM